MHVPVPIHSYIKSVYLLFKKSLNHFFNLVSKTQFSDITEFEKHNFYHWYKKDFIIHVQRWF